MGEDLGPWIDAARADADDPAADPAYRELMATYAALGVQLQRPEPDLAVCRTLLVRTDALSRALSAATAAAVPAPVARVRPTLTRPTRTDVYDTPARTPAQIRARAAASWAAVEAAIAERYGTATA